MYRILFLCTLTSLLSLFVSPAIAQDNTANRTRDMLVFRDAGIERSIQLYLPAQTESDTVTAAVIALHPLFSSAHAMEALSGLNTLADERGWIIAYPQSLRDYWDDGRVENGLPPNDGVVDDVGYLAGLALALREIYGVEHVYLTGQGVGGTMALRAACQTPELYDGVAVVAASMWNYQQPYCDETSATGLDILFILGNQDHRYWEGGRTVNLATLPRIMSTVETVNYWITRQMCETQTDTGQRRSTLLLYTDCLDGSRVGYLTVLNGGNVWFREADNMLNRTGIDATEVIGAFFGGDSDWAEHTAQPTISTDLPRSYTVYVPSSYDADVPMPIVLSLHGRGANNLSQASSTDFNPLAEEMGFIVVYPQAYDAFYNDPLLADAVWNYNLGIPGMEALTWDDDAFLDTLVDDLANDLNIDMSRVYVNGLSNGGYMTNRLACTRADRYAAFAAVAATAPFGMSQLCEDGQHAPIMFYHGTADRISPWEGELLTNDATGQQIYILAPMPNTLSFWLSQNGCDETYDRTDMDSTDPQSRVVFVRYTECPSDAGVEIYTVIDGGHVWHGVEDFSSPVLGEVNMDVNASYAIWAFYSGYTLDGYDPDTAVTLQEIEARMTDETSE